MKITIKELDRCTLSEFADKHGLEMEVVERHPGHWPDGRYYCHFKSCEVKKGSMLSGEYGDGPTIDRAIQDYIKRINSKTLVLNAFSSKKKRREIEVPILTYVGGI